MCKYEMDQMDGWTNGQGETSNTPTYTPTPTSLIWSRRYDNIQIVLPLTSDPVLMAKNGAHYLIYIGCRTSMLKNTSLDSADDIAV